MPPEPEPVPEVAAGLRAGAEGFDRLGFHHQIVESRKQRGRYWLNKWPSRGPWPRSEAMSAR